MTPHNFREKKKNPKRAPEPFFFQKFGRLVLHTNKNLLFLNVFFFQKKANLVNSTEFKRGKSQWN